MALLKIDGVDIKDPSSMNWGISDLSSDESGRSANDGKMTKDVVAQKIKLDLAWNNPTASEVSAILKSVSYKTKGSYFNVTYHDAEENAMLTKEFYVGDRSAPMKYKNVNGTVYSTLSFNIIER
jgi:hypothetical protein